MEYDIATVIGKGRRRRACSFGKRTAQALDRYLRARVRHLYADVRNCGWVTATTAP